MPDFVTGRIRHPEKDDIMKRSHDEHAERLESQQEVELPPKWDSREHGWIGPVLNQEQCNSCWAFSGTGIIEIAYAKAGIQNANDFILSKQYLLSCLKSGEKPYNGCGGGDSTTALMQASGKGIPSRKEYGAYGPYPYLPAITQWPPYFCRLTSDMHMHKISNWGFVDGSPATFKNVMDMVNDTKAHHDFEKYVPTTARIKSAIVHYGAVGAGIAGAINPAFTQLKKGTVFEGTGDRDVDHDIILVGWDDSKGKEGAWLLKNSWGTQWCDDGYCWVAYGANNVGYESVWCEVESD